MRDQDAGFLDGTSSRSRMRFDFVLMILIQGQLQYVELDFVQIFAMYLHDLATHLVSDYKSMIKT